MLGEAAEAFTGGKEDRIAPAPQQLGYDVLVVGGGPAGLSAAAYCGRKFLRTAVFEGDCWGGILTRWCPDKKIDNYPGTRPGVRADELAQSLVDFAGRSGVDLAEIMASKQSATGRMRVASGIASPVGPSGYPFESNRS